MSASAFAMHSASAIGAAGNAKQPANARPNSGNAAASTGTNALARKPGDPLPRLALDGIAVVELNDAGLCQHFRLWWHSVAATD